MYSKMLPPISEHMDKIVDPFYFNPMVSSLSNENSIYNVEFYHSYNLS